VGPLFIIAAAANILAAVLAIAALKPWRRKSWRRTIRSRHRRARGFAARRLLTEPCSGVGGSARRQRRFRNRVKSFDRKPAQLTKEDTNERAATKTRRATTTAEDTLKPEERRRQRRLGRHRVARALKSEGVDTIFSLCGGHSSTSTTAAVDEDIRDRRRAARAGCSAPRGLGIRRSEGHHVNARASSGARALS